MTRPPAPLTKSRRDNAFGNSISLALCLDFFCPADSGKNLNVTAATADQPVECRPDLFVARVRLFIQQGFGRHHPPVQAVSTLKCLFLDEGALNGIGMLGR